MICYRFLVHHLQYRGSTSKPTEYLETRGAPRVLTPLFLVLCRLMMENDLAYQFGISLNQPFVINFLYFKFKDVSLWPSRQQVANFMPKVFKDSYPTTRCIIDATEIFIPLTLKHNN